MKKEEKDVLAKLGEEEEQQLKEKPPLDMKQGSDMKEEENAWYLLVLLVHQSLLGAEHHWHHCSLLGEELHAQHD